MFKLGCGSSFRKAESKQGSTLVVTSVAAAFWICLASWCSPTLAQSIQRTDTLKVDPMILVEVATTWRTIGEDENPLWPEWNATKTPVLIYLPGVQEVLINHPHPPREFSPYNGPLSNLFKSIHLKDGPTLIEWDGQNTSRDVYGAETLVLADTLSNRKNWLRGWEGDPRSSNEKLESLDYRSLTSDSYEHLAMIAHEAFHVFQMKNLPHKAADERSVRVYPCLDPENNAGMAMEAEALLDALEATSEVQRRSAAVRWLAIRKDRRESLSNSAIEYEDRNEFIEGVAKYIEVVGIEALQGSVPSEYLWLSQGFSGYDDLAWFRSKRLQSMRKNMRGEVNVNNDPYGSSPVRGRLYFSGMGIALLLDQLAADWKTRIADSDMTLTRLVELAVQPNEEELARAVDLVKASEAYREVLANKVILDREGQADTQRMLDEILIESETLVEICWSFVGSDKLGLSFTAFGVRFVTEDQSIYTLVPISAELGSSDYSFEQSQPLPTLEDRLNKTFRFGLPRKITAAELSSQLQVEDGESWIIDQLSLDLPGVKIRGAKAHVTFDGRKLRINLLQEE